MRCGCDRIRTNSSSITTYKGNFLEERAARRESLVFVTELTKTLEFMGWKMPVNNS